MSYQDESLKSIKICLMGDLGVGKSTIFRLLDDDSVNLEPRCTLFANITKIDNLIDGIETYLWDFVGSEHFSFVWKQFIKDSHINMIVIDSQEENLKRIRFFLDLSKKTCPKAKILIIANKRDLPNAIPLLEIQNEFEDYETIGLISSDEDSEIILRQKIIEYISIILEREPPEWRPPLPQPEDFS
jgi:GTPase SAR1 family protein